ncbi:MAG: hypothetical protein ACLVEX_06980 [Ruthenibacterium lactatiformans]
MMGHAGMERSDACTQPAASFALADYAAETEDESYCLLWEAMNAEFEQLGAQGYPAARCVYADDTLMVYCVRRKRCGLKNGLLDEIACKNKRYISDLRLFPELKWRALAQLHDLKGKEQYPLAEWSEAVSYLLGCTVHFESYGQITASLKPFAKGMH